MEQNKQNNVGANYCTFSSILLKEDEGAQINIKEKQADDE